MAHELSDISIRKLVSLLQHLRAKIGEGTVKECQSDVDAALRILGHGIVVDNRPSFPHGDLSPAAGEVYA